MVWVKGPRRVSCLFLKYREQFPICNQLLYYRTLRVEIALRLGAYVAWQQVLLIFSQ